MEQIASMLNHISPSQGGKLAHSVAETAEILGISTRSIHRLLDRGLLRASKALRKILIPRLEIEKFLRDTTGEA
jgi:excisionase family DNA binding protein